VAACCRPQLPHWQVIAGQCSTGAQAGQLAARFTSPAPKAEQAADHALAAANAGTINWPGQQGDVWGAEYPLGTACLEPNGMKGKRLRMSLMSGY
jgi:hypothetical protein